MQQDAHELEMELEETRQALRQSWSKIEDRAKASLDVKEKIRRHPVESVAAGMALGLVAGAIMSRRRPNEPEAIRHAAPGGFLRDEINILKGAAAATLVNHLAGYLSELLPKGRPFFTGAAQLAEERYRIRSQCRMD